MQRVNLAEKFSQFSEHWSPRIVGNVDDYHIKIAKVQGEFVWHHHTDVDELFMVIRGRLCIKLRDRDIWLEPGEFAVIPKGVEHKPVADDETEILLFERAGTLNTGNITDSDHTVQAPETL